MFVVERRTAIAAPPEEVFEQIVDLRKWDDWSPWASMDPKMTKTYEGEDGTVDSSYHWTGNRKVGEGKMTITEITRPTFVAIDLNFIKPFKSDNVTEFRIAAADEGCEVTWRMTGKHSLMLKVMGIFRSMDRMIGPDFEEGLTSLKELTEAPEPQAEVEVET